MMVSSDILLFHRWWYTRNYILFPTITKTKIQRIFFFLIIMKKLTCNAYTARELFCSFLSTTSPSKPFCPRRTRNVNSGNNVLCGIHEDTLVKCRLLSAARECEAACYALKLLYNMYFLLYQFFLSVGN